MGAYLKHPSKNNFLARFDGSSESVAVIAVRSLRVEIRDLVPV
jgi:hypothetical protein